LSLFVGFFMAILLGLRRTLKYEPSIDRQTHARALIATLLSILVVLGTTSSIIFIPYIYWSFAGLCVAFVRIAYSDRAVAKRTMMQVAS
jgi:hypothetical protein